MRERTLSFCCINFNFRSPRDESCSPAEPKRVFNENYVRFQQTHPEELCALSQALVAHILPISIQSTRKQQLLSLRRELVMRTTCTCCHTPSPPATRKGVSTSHIPYVCTAQPTWAIAATPMDGCVPNCQTSKENILPACLPGAVAMTVAGKRKHETMEPRRRHPSLWGT